MTGVTRRHFMETAGLAAAVPVVVSVTEAVAQGPARAAATRRTTRARDLTDDELETLT